MLRGLGRKRKEPKERLLERGENWRKRRREDRERLENEIRIAATGHLTTFCNPYIF